MPELVAKEVCYIKISGEPTIIIAVDPDGNDPSMDVMKVRRANGKGDEFIYEIQDFFRFELESAEENVTRQLARKKLFMEKAREATQEAAKNFIDGSEAVN